MGHIYLPIREVNIKLEWKDKVGYTSKDFKTIQELAEFLQQYPDLAREVNYIPKQKKQ